MQNAKERMNCGVSIDFLVDFNDRLFKGVEAPGVQLFVCTRDSNHFGYGNKSYSLKLKKGETVQFIYEADTDEWYGYVPKKGEGTFDPRLVRPKVREEWSIQDVVQHVVKPATYNGSTSYVNSMLKQSQVGKPYKGVMVQPATRDTPFRNFVQSMGSYFDRVDAREDRFIWLDAFCAPQRENSGFAFANANMSAKFSTRVHYFAAPSLQQKSMNKNKNKNRSQSVLLGAVFVGNQKDQQLVTICLDYGLVEGITKIVAHLKFLQMILNIHAAVFGEAYEQYGSNGNGKGKGKGKKNGQKGMNGKKSKYFNSKKGFRLSSSGSGKGSKFGLGFGSSVGSKSQLGLNNSVATKKKKSGKFNFDFDFGFDLDESMLFEKGVDMKMKGKGKGKGKNGKNYSAIGEVMELTPEEVLTNDAVVDALTDLIPEQDRPELAQQDFLNAILSNTTLL